MRALVVVAVLCLPCVALADPAAVAAQSDALYAARHEPGKMAELRKLSDESVEANPTDYGTLWRAARAYFWMSETSTTPKDKESYGRRAWELGERAVKADPTKVEGHYMSALGIGAYSQAVGIMKAITQGLEGKFNERLDKAIALNPRYNTAGPLVAKGRYFYELPWPKRNLEKSAQLLQKAIELEPGALRAHLYLAQTLLRDGEPKKAQASLNKVLSGSEAYDVAEARHIKKLAGPVKAEIEAELN